MPVQPYSIEYMIDILTKIDNAKCVDWINLNELTFNNLNEEKYKESWYKLDLPNDPTWIYHRYYDVKKIEIWVYSSKLICLELIDYFAKRKASFYMHYCDLDTVSHHQYVHKKITAKSLKIPYTTITSFWLHKILRIYSNLNKAISILESNNISKYSTNNIILETSIDYLKYFENKWFCVVVVYKNFDYKYDVDFKIINI